MPAGDLGHDPGDLMPDEAQALRPVEIGAQFVRDDIAAILLPLYRQQGIVEMEVRIIDIGTRIGIVGGRRPAQGESTR